MWIPASEAEIQSAIDAATLTESHTLEAKREWGGAPAERAETGRDLASFAIDGGVILFGVAEIKKEHRFELAPMQLEGAIEAIEQIAAMSIDPPLSVRATEIPTANDSTRGYIAVSVGESPEAPHMVGGVYYARNERTRRRLSDAEVIRYHAARKDQDGRIVAALLQDVRSDPISLESRQLGHLFVTALPVTASPTAAESIAWDQDKLRKIAGSAEALVPPSYREWAPTPNYASTVASRAEGLALTSLGRPGLDEEGSALDIAFREDGSIHLFLGRLTANASRNPQNESLSILDGLMLAWVFRVIGWTTALANAIGYSGRWDIGVAGTKLRGAPAHSIASDWNNFGSTPYDADAYQMTTRASATELSENPEFVAGRLLNRLVRSLGAGSELGPHLGWPTDGPES